MISPGGREGSCKHNLVPTPQDGAVQGLLGGDLEVGQGVTPGGKKRGDPQTHRQDADLGVGIGDGGGIDLSPEALADGNSADVVGLGKDADEAGSAVTPHHIPRPLDAIAQDGGKPTLALFHRMAAVAPLVGLEMVQGQ